MENRDAELNPAL